MKWSLGMEIKSFFNEYGKYLEDKDINLIDKLGIDSTTKRIQNPKRGYDFVNDDKKIRFSYFYEKKKYCEKYDYSDKTFYFEKDEKGIKYTSPDYTLLYRVGGYYPMTGSVFENLYGGVYILYMNNGTYVYYYDKDAYEYFTNNLSVTGLDLSVDSFTKLGFKPDKVFSSSSKSGLTPLLQIVNRMKLKEIQVEEENKMSM